MFAGTEDSFKVNKSSAHGFGLYVSKKITEMLTFEGDEGLTFSSEYGVGSSFKFFLENKT